MSFFRTKSIERILAESESGPKLKRSLSALDLTTLGIGGIIGTGIFVLTGVGAAKYAGPALALSFIIAGLACTFAALCYAEFASMVPVSGSAYTYGYAALGEIFAWIIGWDLMLEYALAVSTVAVGWSGYFVDIIKALGINLPDWAIAAPELHGGFINLPAVAITVIIATLLARGIKESSNVNNIIVFVKLAVIVLFIILGVSHVKPVNWHPFLPFGFKGVVSGAAVIFFAYLGFDAVSTVSEEAKNPQRDLPRGIIFSLLICTALYIIVSLILTGMVPYKLLNNSAPVAFALKYIGNSWGVAFVSVGAMAGITSVLLVMMLGQTRIFYAMSRDGLMPPVFSEVHKKYKTPVKSTVLTCVVTAALAGLTPIQVLAEMANIGTLAAFVIVSIAVMVLRKKKPDLKRPFRTPLVPLVPILAVIFCGYLIYSLPVITWMRFIIWMIIGLAFYFSYSYKHSKLNYKR